MARNVWKEGDANPELIKQIFIKLEARISALETALETTIRSCTKLAERVIQLENLVELDELHLDEMDEEPTYTHAAIVKQAKHPGYTIANGTAYNSPSLNCRCKCHYINATEAEKAYCTC